MSRERGSRNSISGNQAATAPARQARIYNIAGTVEDASGAPVPNLEVEVWDRDLFSRDDHLARATTSAAGYFEMQFDSRKFDDLGLDRDPDVYFKVLERGNLLLSTESEAMNDLRQTDMRITLRLRQLKAPEIRIGPIPLNREAVDRATPSTVINIAKALADPDAAGVDLAEIKALSPLLLPESVRRTLCGTTILQTIEALIEYKDIDREIRLEIEDILTGRMKHFAFTQVTYDCPNFRVFYWDGGAEAPDSDTGSQTVLEPGGSAVLATLPAGGPPTYVKRVCFWLERALATYINPPFSMRNPAAGGRIPVYINSSAFGSASSTPFAFYINNALNNDILCAVAVHELFHMVQFQYALPWNEPWNWSLMEGGAVFAEDTAADRMNRYLYEGSSPDWSGVGVQVDPNRSLESSGYDCALFWRYVAEQHSPRINPGDEPLIGVETYRTILETAEAGTQSAADIRNALRALPWHQDFYEFEYIDPARLDLSRSETTFGNYALACYLKQLGVNQPDRRFDFMEDAENIFFDDVLNAIFPVSAATTLINPALTSSATLGSGTTFTNSLNRFASRFYEITIDPSVTNVRLQFSASGGLTSCLFQAALIDATDSVRDIIRTDTTSYTKEIANLRDGVRLSKVAIVVTGADSSGNFSVSVSPAAAAPDVMVTRWNSIVKNEYEIDSRDWSWTWVSPDIWVDNNSDGVADGTVFFNTNNKLFVRLHNKGTAAASGIGVTFWYQNAAGGLSAAWQPVVNMGGAVQTLSNLSLAAGASNRWSVDWSPAPSGASTHFCVRVVVTAPGDPNSDNKRAMSNFGNVVLPFGRFIDVSLLRRALRGERVVNALLVPRLPPGIEISRVDARLQAVAVLKPGEEQFDRIRILHRRVTPMEGHAEPDVHVEHACHRATHLLPRTPDLSAHYPTEVGALPPGVAGKPLVTVVHQVDGRAIGGVTYMVELEPPAR